MKKTKKPMGLAGLLAALAVLTGVLLPAGPAAAAPSASVAPTTGLRPGDTVMASGSGFDPDDVVTIAQCSEAGCAFPEGEIAPASFAVATIAGDGTLSGSIEVAASVKGFPCRPTGCWVAIGGLVGGTMTVVSETPITFVAPSPAVTVTPATGLLERHHVQARATGLDHRAAYAVAQCGGSTVATCRTVADEDRVHRVPSGLRQDVVADRFTIARTPLRLVRQLDAAGTRYDCSLVTCRVGVIDARGALIASTPLAFEAEGVYHLPQATLQVQPTTGLRETQTLTLQASGLDGFETYPDVGFAFATIDICAVDLGCQPGVWFEGSIARFRVMEVGIDGRATTTLPFDRFLLFDGGPMVDCAAVGCYLVVHQDNASTNTVPLAFAPEWAPWPDVDRFLTEGVEAIRGAPLTPAARSDMANALAARTLRGPAVLVQAASGTPSDATVGEVTRLYRAFFGRAVETGGLGYWVGRLQAGATVSSIGRSFGGTPEFRSQYDGLSNAQVVDKAYANTLGRAPDADGRAYWTARLDQGMARSTLIVHFARSAEFKAREQRRVTVTQITWGLLGRVPGPVELTLNPLTVIQGLLSHSLPRP